MFCNFKIGCLPNQTFSRFLSPYHVTSCRYFYRDFQFSPLRPTHLAPHLQTQGRLKNFFGQWICITIRWYRFPLDKYASKAYENYRYRIYRCLCRDTDTEETRRMSKETQWSIPSLQL